jgi:hypothetical protein
MLGSLKPFLLAFALAALATTAAVAQQAAKVTDEQRCTGQAGVTPEAQAAACTALIDSKRFTRTEFGDPAFQPRHRPRQGRRL